MFADGESEVEAAAKVSQIASQLGRDSREIKDAIHAAEGDFGMLARARMGRTLSPEAGSIGGGGFTGSATAHGAERMAEAGFDDIDVALMRGGSRYEQSDGAFAYVAQAGRNSYNMFVENTKGAVVTAHRGMSFDDLSGLARNFGWSGW
jgi:hypothetical protein